MLGVKASFIAWLGIFSFHAVCAAYFVGAGLLYHALPTTTVAGMLSMYSLTLNIKYFRFIAAVHFAVAALHLYPIGRSFIGQVFRRFAPRWLMRKAKRVRRAIRGSSQYKVEDGPSQQRQSDSRARSVASTIFRRAWSNLRTLYGMLFARNGFFSVEGNYFETVFLCREVFETSLQTYQAYQMSCLLPRAWLNRFFVTVLVINCWSTPVVHHVFHHNVPLQRLLCMLSDILLDFVSAIAVPVVLAFGYMRQYEPKRTDFSLDLWYNDQWLIRLMNDTPIILLNSWVDALSRLAFSLSILGSLSDVKELITPKPKPRLATKVPAHSTATDISVENIHALQRDRVICSAHRIMFCFGVAVLSVQLYAESRPTPTSCVLVIRPWLVRQPACALIEINCYETPQLSGNRSDFTATVGDINALSLEHLSFRHCPHVEITARLHAFHNLIGIKTYNSTFVTWDQDAAITHTYLPRMRFMFFVHTNFPNATLPPALLSTEFPVTLTDVEFAGTNINWLPDDLDERWPPNLTLFIEFSQLAYFPEMLQKLSPVMLSLIGNRITAMPPAAMNFSVAYTIALSKNPLQSLPETDVDPRAVATRWFFLDSTNITTLPTWVDDTFVKDKRLYLGNTPICRDVFLNDTSVQRAALQDAWPDMDTEKLCYKAFPDDEGFYPLHVDVRAAEIW